jgi:hypothetical protein
MALLFTFPLIKGKELKNITLAMLQIHPPLFRGRDGVGGK